MRLNSIAIFLTTLLLAQVVQAEGGVSVSKEPDGRSHCTVTPIGNSENDVPNLLKAFDICGKHGVITFPEGTNYTIGEKLNPIVDDVLINWSGIWTYTNNITYWRNNTYHIEFQNHWAGFVLTGRDITILGNGVGGVNGNGDVWYTAEAGDTQPGRPMPFVLWNVSNVVVKDFNIWQPQLWSFNIMNGENILVDGLHVNATATLAPAGANWVQNTDGFDTMDVRNVTLLNHDYTGGDDCIAIKPRTYGGTISNVTCHKGNGIAIGSLGQYLTDASVEDISFRDLAVGGTINGFYIKTWMGHLVYQDSYESEYQPRGGGWGTVKNILVENMNVTGAEGAFTITQDSGDDSAHDYVGTSKMLVADVVVRNVYGTLDSTSNEVSVSCSTVHPCYGIVFEDMTETDEHSDNITLSCSYTADGGVTGLGGC